MAHVPTSAVAAGGLVGGYAAARWTGKRPLGGVVLAAMRRPGRPRVAPPHLTDDHGPARRGLHRRVRRIAPPGQEDRPLVGAVFTAAAPMALASYLAADHRA